jgi:hypothetical protein
MSWYLVKHRNNFTFYLHESTIYIIEPLTKSIPGASFKAANWPEREADYSIPSSAEVKNMVSLYMSSSFQCSI